MEGALFTVALAGGERVTGSLVAGTVECRGQSLDAGSILALDRHTLFLSGPVQVDVECPPGPKTLSGFLELEVRGVGPVRLPLERIETILQHPS